jgi:hypothetical protein
VLRAECWVLAHIQPDGEQRTTSSREGQTLVVMGSRAAAPPPPGPRLQRSPCALARTCGAAVALGRRAQRPSVRRSRLSVQGPLTFVRLRGSRGTAWPKLRSRSIVCARRSGRAMTAGGRGLMSDGPAAASSTSARRIPLRWSEAGVESAPARSRFPTRYAAPPAAYRPPPPVSPDRCAAIENGRLLQPDAAS